MLCFALQPICGSALIVKGAYFTEPAKLRQDALDTVVFHYLAVGKDASIDSMIEGRDGFPLPVTPLSFAAQAAFDAGANAERHDLRSLLRWQRNRALCLTDRAVGRTD